MVDWAHVTKMKQMFQEIVPDVLMLTVVPDKGMYLCVFASA